MNALLMNRLFSVGELGRTIFSCRREWMYIVLLSMIANVLMLVPTLYMLQIYDRVLIGRNEYTLALISIIALYLFGVMAGAEWLRSRLAVTVGLSLDNLLRKRIFELGFVEILESHSDGAKRALDDLMRLRQFLTGAGLYTLLDIPWVVVYIGALSMLHPLLGLMAVAFATVQTALALKGRSQAMVPTKVLDTAQTVSDLYLQGKLKNRDAIEAMGMLQGLQKRWEKLNYWCRDQNAALRKVVMRTSSWSKGVRHVQQSLALSAGALLVIDGQLSPGAMIAANILMARALSPIDQLMGAWQEYIGARLSFVRLNNLIERGSGSVKSRFSANLEGGVQFLNFTAKSHDGALQLDAVNFSIEAGLLTVVMGPSGAGKSTLIRCLLGIHPAAHGKILFDGVPVEHWSREALTAQIGYLPQNVALFSGSIAENIARLGSVDSSKVIAAAKCAGLHEMVLQFQNGYDTQIGENGYLLSGGERQRIALARALYDNPKLIALDEPDSNLDEYGEIILLETLRTLKSQGKTVVMVTHRSKVLEVADRTIM
ncbi:MAG: type I secretion system permease/ATPase, partial [Cytophagaceae bacterium]